MSSPLTSLSSLDDPDERQLPGLSLRLPDPEDLKAAQVDSLAPPSFLNSVFFVQLLCSFQNRRRSVAGPSTNGFIRQTVDSGMQTEPERVYPSRTKDSKLHKMNATPKVGRL
jgi:hypothetical protein